MEAKRSFARVFFENRFVDRLLLYRHFVKRHHRLPTDKLLFNDVLYKILTTDEIVNPLRVFVSDKEFVKIYVKSIVGDRYNVPTVDVIRSVDEIKSYNFPFECCIKPTHASGYAVIRREGCVLDNKMIEKWYSINYYNKFREANYKTLKPKVIVEPIIFNNVNVNDYKFFCLNGVVKLVQVDVDRYIDHKRKLFTVDWTPLEFSVGCAMYHGLLEKPENYSEMLEVAAKLSAGFGFVRIDIYSDGKQCLVGEITNCHGSALERFIPESGEERASEIIFGS
jgi:hypothetical protein